MHSFNYYLNRNKTVINRNTKMNKWNSNIKKKIFSLVIESKKLMI